MKRFLFFTSFLLFFSINIYAQINVEEMRKDIDEGNKVSGVLDFAIDTKSGNKNKLSTSSSGLIALQTDRHLIFTAASAEFETGNGDKIDQYWQILGRHNFQLRYFLFTDLFTQYENDVFRKLRSRSIVGIGPRFKYDFTYWFCGIFGTSYLYEYNLVINQPDSDFHRWNNYASLLFIFGTFNIIETIYYQPAFDHPNNFRIYNNLTFKTGISKSLDTKISFTYRHESIPLENNINTTDIHIRSGFELDF